VHAEVLDIGTEGFFGDRLDRPSREPSGLEGAFIMQGPIFASQPILHFSLVGLSVPDASRQSSALF